MIVVVLLLAFVVVRWTHTPEQIEVIRGVIPGVDIMTHPWS